MCLELQVCFFLLGLFFISDPCFDFGHNSVQPLVSSICLYFASAHIHTRILAPTLHFISESLTFFLNPLILINFFGSVLYGSLDGLRTLRFKERRYFADCG